MERWHNPNASVVAGITFRSLVKNCAEQPRLVETFNRLYGANLQAPIAALLNDQWPPQVSAEEEVLIGCFIVFVHEQIWIRLQRAQERTSRRCGALSSGPS